MQPLPLSPEARQLVSQLEAAQTIPQHPGRVFHVASLGTGFFFAYEQLRNVAEYREHHLLLRSAIERFLARYVRFNNFEPIASEIVTELTQSGYLKNDSVPQTTIEAIDACLSRYAEMYHEIRGAKHISSSKVGGWIVQTASVHLETMLAPDPHGAVFMQFAYEHYLASVDPRSGGHAALGDQKYRIALYCAVQRAIFKSDSATTRYFCLNASLPDLQHQPIEHFVGLNRLLDEYYQNAATNRLFRLINRYGAPIRILREYVMSSDSVPTHITDRAETLSKLKSLCAQQYRQCKDRVSARVGKAILFILITKTLIGISVEVPYDLLMFSAISALPLAINIIFPLIYMATIGTRIAMPGRQNTEVIADYLDRILYADAGAPVTYKPKRRVKSSSLNGVFTVVYTVGFSVSIALLIWALRGLGYNLVNGLIFFIFFSAVSFLGFRLRQSARELAILDERQSIIQALLDFLSSPFVTVGHWLSDKYAKANFVTIMLDVAIEMPLKTTLRLAQQWVGFLRDKQEEL